MELFVVHTPKGKVTGIQARIEHAKAISELSRADGLIKRSEKEIAEIIGNYCVLVNELGVPIGCVGFKEWGADREIITFRLVDVYHRLGLGKIMLQDRLVYLLNQPDVARIFALTKRETYRRIFKKMGFVRAGIQLFTPKAIEDCGKCDKNRLNEDGIYLCDEITVLYWPENGK